MGFFSKLFDFKSLVSMSPDNPGRKAFEQAVKEYWQAQYGVDLLKADSRQVDMATATVQDMYAAMESLSTEVNRLLLLSDRKTVFTVKRTPTDVVPLHVDSSLKDVVFWAMAHRHTDLLVYEEVYVADPTQGDKLRSIERKTLGPVQALASEHA